MERYIGKMLDNRYEILEVIGTGGMAVVFKAKCHRLNRLVAIKMLKRDLSDDAEFRRRFHDESQAVAMLSHPNIMAIYDVSRGGDMDYIVMELIDGITLKQYMERRGKLNWPEALHFITQIMKGLSHAHSRGIVHRDIKPQNIMILRDGTVKVTDFGIAFLANGSNPSNEAIGSVHYISPEQARGDYTDNRSDIYSAGVVLYEMLTNRLPFDGKDPMSVAIQHISATPPSPRELDPEIPEALEQICMKAMATDRNQRYSTADEMLADLEAFRKDPTLSFDYTVEDLQQEKSDDEPTRFIPNVAVTRSKPTRYAEPLDEEDDDDEPPKWKGIVKVLIFTVLLAGIGYYAVTGLYGFVMDSFKPAAIPEYKVPDLQNLTVEEARDLVEKEGVFNIVEHDYAYHDTIPEKQIIDQEPKAGQVKKSADGNKIDINVTVSNGTISGGMPNLVGEESRSAKLILEQDKKLSSLHLVVVEGEEEYSDSVPVGHVTRTEPAAYAVLKEGDTVTLHLSKGPKIRYVTMITAVGQSMETVQMQMDKLGLVAEFVPVESAEPVGQVLKQSVDADESIPEGTTVTFEYSDGLKMVTKSVSISLPFKFTNMQVEVFLDDTSILSSEMPGTTGTIEQTLAAAPGSHRLRVYVDDSLIEDREIMFGE